VRKDSSVIPKSASNTAHVMRSASAPLISAKLGGRPNDSLIASANLMGSSDPIKNCLPSRRPTITASRPDTL